MSPFWIGVAVALVAVVLMYNTLVGRRNQVDNIFATLDALLKKRYDLVPNLVASVQEYMRHESDVLTRVTALRARSLSPGLCDDDKIALSNDMSDALKGVMIAVENYPLLKASDTFLHLQQSLTEIEEQISAGRRAYNQAVTDYNNAVQMFPTSTIASLAGFRPRIVLQIPAPERDTVRVTSLFDRS